MGNRVGTTYEVILSKGELGKTKIEIRMVPEKGVLCEIDCGGEKLPNARWQPIRLSKEMDCKTLGDWLRSLRIDPKLKDCAEELEVYVGRVEEWIRQAGGKGEEGG